MMMILGIVLICLVFLFVGILAGGLVLFILRDNDRGA